MILLVTNRRDITSDYIVLELQRRNAAYFRLNTEALPDARVRFGQVGWDDWSIQLDMRVIAGSDITGAYLRRPGEPAPNSAILDEAERRYCQAEWTTLLKSLYSRLDGRWLSPPAAIMLAEDKPRQLLMAAELGFSVPPTIITNDVAASHELSNGVGLVGKPLRNALLEDDTSRVMFTSRLGRLSTGDDEALSAAPIILQQEITKQSDIRVTVVGDRIFAVAIHSQSSPETEVDWRSGSDSQLPHEVIELPPDLANQCVLLTKALGLRFGAIDLVLDREGRFWFLEINPNGQWAWIENRTGMPIASAIVDELEQIGRE